MYKVGHHLVCLIGIRNWAGQDGGRFKGCKSTRPDSTLMYRAGCPICRKVLKIMFLEVPPADWLIL